MPGRATLIAPATLENPTSPVAVLPAKARFDGLHK